MQIQIKTMKRLIKYLESIGEDVISLEQSIGNRHWLIMSSKEGEIQIPAANNQHGKLCIEKMISENIE